MASPHVAGLVAYLLAAEGNISPDAMIKKVQDYALKDKLSGIREYLDLAFNNNSLLSAS